MNRRRLLELLALGALGGLAGHVRVAEAAPSEDELPRSLRTPRDMRQRIRWLERRVDRLERVVFPDTRDPLEGAPDA